MLRLVAWGYTNKEVAGYLNISVKTVETHKTNLMEKLDLNGRSDIVRYALRRGGLRSARAPRVRESPERYSCLPPMYGAAG